MVSPVATLPFQVMVAFILLTLILTSCPQSYPEQTTFPVTFPSPIAY
jgi:hypothetical protein